MICAHCEEMIGPGERADNEGSDFHRECMFRGVAGSVAHQMKECSCYRPGSTQGDPPFLTRRQAAKLAWDYAHGHVLAMYSIFDHPKDAPQHFVVRTVFIWHDTAPEPVIGQARYAASLLEARELIPQGAVRLERAPEDVDHLLETWV